MKFSILRWWRSATEKMKLRSSKNRGRWWSCRKPIYCIFIWWNFNYKNVSISVVMKLFCLFSLRFPFVSCSSFFALFLSFLLFLWFQSNFLLLSIEHLHLKSRLSDIRFLSYLALLNDHYFLLLIFRINVHVILFILISVPKFFIQILILKSFLVVTSKKLT